MMSEAVEQSSIPPEEKGMEVDEKDDTVQEKTTSMTSDTDLKKDADAFVKEGERTAASTAKGEVPKVLTVTPPNVDQEMATTTESHKEKILTPAPSIKIEPGIISDSAGDSQGKIHSIKLEKETTPESIQEEAAVPALSKTLVDDNAAVLKEKVPEDEKVAGTVKTNTINNVKESVKEQEKLTAGNSMPSPNIELSGSTTVPMDTTSILKDSPPTCTSSSGESMTVPADKVTVKTDIPISEIKKETLSMTETPAVKETPKESSLTSDSQMTTLAEACVVSEKDQLEVDNEMKPVTDISKDNVQKAEMSKQGDLQTTHIPSDSNVQNNGIHDSNGVQKQETELIKGSMQHKGSVAMDVAQKKEVPPQMAMEQSKAVHEIIAEQSSRLDRERLVPTSVPLERPSLVQTSIPPSGENPIQTSIPSSVADNLPTSSSGGLASVPVPVASGLEKPVPMPASSIVENLVATSLVSSSGGIGVPTSVPSVPENIVPKLVPSERDSLVPAPVSQLTSEPEPEPVTRPESTVSDTPDPKPVVQEALDDWDIPASDDEEDEGDNQMGDGVEKKKRTAVKRGYWEPPIDVIVELYNKLDKEGILELEWKCPGRRPPSEEGDKEEEKEQLDDVENEEAMEISQEEDPTEFDFDMDVDLDSSVKKMTPRRNLGPGQAQGSGKKRVARMDKVLNDIFRHRKIDSTMVDSKKKDEEGKDPTEQAMDTSTSPILAPSRPADKFHIRSDLNM